jgi:molecular chaperone DnaK (HSP70)
VGTKAVEQQETNPANTIYDAKRFIGKQFKEDDPQFQVIFIQNIYIILQLAIDGPESLSIYNKVGP